MKYLTILHIAMFYLIANQDLINQPKLQIGKR
jgi:hypothetical protein